MFVVIVTGGAGPPSEHVNGCGERLDDGFGGKPERLVPEGYSHEVRDCKS